MLSPGVAGGTNDEWMNGPVREECAVRPNSSIIVAQRYIIDALLINTTRGSGGGLQAST